MAVWRFVGWLTGLAGRSPAAQGLVVAVLVLILAALVVVLVRSWPASRRWAALNRLHRVADRNEADLRAAARRELGDAARSLEAASRDCLRRGREDEAADVDHLLRDLHVARDRVASGYLPSPANAPRQRRELNLAMLGASEAVAAHCAAIASCSRGGAPPPAGMIRDARQALTELNDRGLAVP